MDGGVETALDNNWSAKFEALDAASTPRPHMGFGVSKAGAETQALAEALSNSDDIDRPLAAYNAIRQPLGERIVSHGRKLGTQLGIGLWTGLERRIS